MTFVSFLQKIVGRAYNACLQNLQARFQFGIVCVLGLHVEGKRLSASNEKRTVWTVFKLKYFCRILSGILIKSMNMSGFCLVVKTIIPLSSSFFLGPAIHRQNKTEKKWNTTGLESWLQNLKTCIIGSSYSVYIR